MEFRTVVELYNKMKENGVVIYGAGKRGEVAFDILAREGIDIVGVADRDKHKVFRGVMYSL